MSEQPAAPTGASPIADLSYRNYDGPLMTRAVRWWTVAISSIRLVMKKKGFWFVTAISVLPYVFIGFALYMFTMAMDSAAQSGAVQMAGAMGMGDKFDIAKDARTALLSALHLQTGLWLFIIAMIAGPSSIAADNQSNALLVYLSKPLTKSDYLIGKWMGIFLIITAVALVPNLLLYLFFLFSYLSKGFFSQDPFLFLRVIFTCMIPAALHASLLVGLSAWSKTPRMAGAIYAAVYFIGPAISAILWGSLYHGDLTQGALIRNLSIGGLTSSLTQNAYGVGAKDSVSALGGFGKLLDAPETMPVLAIYACVCLVGILAARTRIRAVEVVSG
jgi:ABC-2 type transport system permease protein